MGVYNLQATFSLSSWPFSLKLLWAPIVDSIYINFIGRRKTWLIITQYAIGIELLVLASYIDDWFGRDPNKAWSQLGSHHSVDIIPLTITFFVLTFLTATQDIAVDGWALTLLSKLLSNCMFIPILHFIPNFRIISNDTLMKNDWNMTTLNNFTTNTNDTLMLMKNKPTYSFQWIFYVILISGFLFDRITALIVFLQFQAFSVKISDPVIGGTYMTLLNTVQNIAGALGNTICLALIEPLTIRSCTKNGSHTGIHTNASGTFLNGSLVTKNTTCHALDGNNITLLALILKLCLEVQHINSYISLRFME
ncbi:putative solute carrier family 33 (acetyl-CoA transporter [Schistosoma mansoni]|uniref:putative solute carrier family 33 (acetyl-CoA transporter n=1 Tax=Schistosoma mansoni TaxID=6183 RepID=UPI00022DC133|nr:putative solute carrier family 33 (acetyl-CoA transporter [Schistosoma mansoni]|eukprot:XP_018647824.1 putative solute carrier family 33 (acetyl-CoA transporter [Schistosoma mansoni]